MVVSIYKSKKIFQIKRIQLPRTFYVGYAQIQFKWHEMIDTDECIRVSHNK